MFHTLTLVPEEVIAMEEATKEQAKSKMWYAQRAERTIASRFKVVQQQI